MVWQDLRAPSLGNKVLQYDVPGGGMVGTALVAVARLGGRAEFWGAVGEDATGRMILEEFQREGVDVSQAVPVPGGRGPIVLVCVDKGTGERHFFGGTGFGEAPEPIGDLSRLVRAGCLLVDGFIMKSARRAAAEARRLGVPVVGDVSRIREKSAEFIACMDYVIASDLCMAGLGAGDDYRKACCRLRAMGPKVAVITRGARGLAAMDGEAFLEMPAFPVEVVDTTGAGDTFHGAFCLGLVRGMPLPEILQFASAAAAMKCRRLGGRAGIPSHPEVLAFLRRQGTPGKMAAGS
jgi:sugar/nucleoside kinase (ribokinase family)